MKKSKAENSLQLTREFFQSTPYLPWAALILITALFTLIHFPKQTELTFSYEIGDVARRDIKAHKNFFVEDRDATQAKKNQVKNTVRNVYDLDSELFEEISDHIDQAFEIPEKLLRKTDPSGNGTAQDPPPTEAIVMATREAFETALGVSIAEDAYGVLHNHEFAPDIPKLIKTILDKILTNGVVANKDLLLKEENKGIILRTIQNSDEKIVNSLKVFYGPDQAKAMVRIIGQPLLREMNYNLRNLIVDICQRLLQPNITLNKSETEKRILEAESLIKPVLYKIKAGEMILREGERVDQIKQMKLAALQDQVEKKNLFISIAGKVLITFISLLAVYTLFIRHHPKLKTEHNKHITFLALGLMLYLIMARFITPITQSAGGVLPFDIGSSSMYMFLPISAGAMTVCLFLGFDIALYFSIIISVLTALNFSNNFEVFIFYFLSSIAAAYWVNQNKERKDFIIASFKLATFNVLIALSLSLYSLSSTDLSTIGIEALLAFTGGILAGVLTTGFTPLIEFIFDYTTEIKLLEFSNLDQPVIKRLMIEAPGTYNHSVIVATLAEAAASAIGANGLIAKVCGYYHDIGKLDKTLYFIENQADGKNRHDKLSPNMSALILIQHVKKGVELAKKYKLGKEIIDGIQQHHGTSLIKYFYNKSLSSGNENVNEGDFRYPGPKPQTREAGIVMLADVVEAAVRALERPTPARIQGRVKELINNIFADGQLEECELTLKDLHEIAKSFNNILTSIYHSRIEYTDKPQEKKKEKNGSIKDTHRQPAKQNGGHKPGSQKDRTDLKRLGI
ncbi:MAG: HDIG domain-containing protein [Desulfobacteraceae bacterium]|nr:MAG: HDIG domain-containing protein [Desulfobacteraceae bacterium]